MPEKITAPRLAEMKSRGQRIVCITAYDATFGRIAEAAGVDLILVGDSVGNVLLGYPTTVSVTLADMVHHTKAVATSVKRPLLVADLPFGSYQGSVEQCVNSAVQLMQSGAEAVKLEGVYVEQVRALVKAGIPVLGHLGMTPQSVNKFGGFRVQGRGSAGEQLTRDALALEEAGVSALVLELIPAELATTVTSSLRIPTIGIGAGVNCDGEIQVLHDILGLSGETFKHSRRFAEGATLLTDALKDYAAQVRTKEFPSSENAF